MLWYNLIIIFLLFVSGKISIYIVWRLIFQFTQNLVYSSFPSFMLLLWRIIQLLISTGSSSKQLNTSTSNLGIYNKLLLNYWRLKTALWEGNNSIKLCSITLLWLSKNFFVLLFYKLNFLFLNVSHDTFIITKNHVCQRDEVFQIINYSSPFCK